MKTKNIFKIILLTLFFSLSLVQNTQADGTDVNLTIRSGNTIIFSNQVSLPPAGTIELNSHSLNANSVLSLINTADISSSDFSISDLQYYDSFGSFYLKCIESQIGTNCDNWQFTVNDVYPNVSMDQKILSGGENVYVYFGPQNKITLSSNSINTDETLTVTTKKYDYQNNNWIIRTDATVGLTQPDPNNPFSPTEIRTIPVDTNGQANFSNILIGSYNVGVKEDYYFPTENLTVSNPPSANTGGSSGGSSYSPPVIIEKTKFNNKKGFEFLISQQKEDGSFGENLYTDWVAISLASKEKEDFKIKSIINLIKYMTETKISGELLTDYERHAMALMSLGLDPYNTNDINYIKKITDNFDGTQFGNIKEDNDDIFALIVLQNAGYTKDELIIKNTISFILSKQKENGSWDESVDMTSASIQALKKFTEDEKVKNALNKAKEYLKQSQKNDGGFGNVSSTAWAMGGIFALSEKIEDWTKNDNTPLHFLASMQDNDGSIKDEYIANKIWQTAYVLTSLSEKTWTDIMQKFGKKEEIKNTIQEIITDEIKTNIKKEENKRTTIKKSGPKKELIDLNIQKEPSTTILPASTSTSSAFLRFFKKLFGKIW